MPQFDYKARQADGNTVTGRIESADRRQAAQRLQEQQLSPVTLKEVSSAKRSIWSQLRDKTKSLKSPKHVSDN
ncbi:MAG: hypothetical protein QMB33_02750, partial [Opitutales bacterium]